MKSLVQLNIIPEYQILRNDTASEVDLFIGIMTGEEKAREKLKQNLNLCIVIDRSGSMAGDKLDIAKDSCIEISNKLKKEDLFSVVVYDDEAEVIINPQTEKKDIREKIQGIQSGGSTNLSLGWYLGLLELQTYMGDNRINKLVMLSDGQANAGETKKSILSAQASKLREDFGITNSTIGIGDDFNEELLDAIAAESGGRFWYIKESSINTIIEAEFEGALETLYESPKIELVLPKGVSISKELNDLRKISDKYTLRPITSNYDNGFVVRVVLEPSLIEKEQIEIKAILYNQNKKVQECMLNMQLRPYVEFVASPVNSTVRAMVSKYHKSKTEEMMIEKVGSGDYDFMKNMIIKEVDGMKKVVDAMVDERKKKEMELELDEMKNMELVSEVVDQLESMAGLDKKMLEEFLNQIKKSWRHQRHRNVNHHMYHFSDGSVQLAILKNASLLIESIIEDQPGNIELKNLKQKVDDRLASY